MQDYIYKLNRADKLLRKCLLGSSIFILAFLISALSVGIFQKPYNSYADEVIASVRSTGYTLSLSATEQVDLIVDATVDGAMAVSKDTINVKSNSSNGYRVYISSDGYAEGDNSLKFGDTFSIAPTSGTVDEPAPLGTNSWGFAVPGLGNFDAAYSDSAPDKNAKFAAVPLRGHETMIASSDGATAAEGDDVDVYFAINANVQVAAGTYRGNVVYSAVSSSSSSEEALVSSSPSTTSKMTGGEEISIATGLMATAAAVTEAAATQGVPVAEVTIGDIACTNVALSNSESGHIIITCSAPAHDTGTYDISVSIPSYEKHYYLVNALTYRSTIYRFFAITNMQEMTNATCAELPTPTTTATQSATESGSVMTNINAEGKTTVVPETTLTDIRDGKTYVVRKLADGNCWMSQNLELDFLGNTLNGQADGAAQDYSKDVETSTLTAGNDNNDAVTADNYKGDTVSGTFRLTSEDTDLNSMDEWTPEIFKTTYGSVAPYAEVYSTQVSNRTSTNSKYGWANNGMDGIRSYSYPGTAAKYSLDDWLYSIRNGSSTFTHEDVTYELDKFSSAASAASETQRYGNLYNFTAATLGSSLSTAVNANVQDSICPKGWKLPDNSGSDSYYNLLYTTYGLTDGNKLPGHSDASSNTNTDFNKLDEFPLDFYRTGLYYRSYGYINYRTADGYWWSGTAGTAAQRGRNLSSYTGYVYAQGNHFRGYGFAVRCVAR